MSVISGDTYFESSGYCPVCEKKSSFVARSEKPIPDRWQPHWFRDSLRCVLCKSPPRERAISYVLNQARKNWRELRIHESSPGGWAFSSKLRRECKGYVATQYEPTFVFGEMHSSGKWRNEDLEGQTFGDECFDIVITQDVFEHLFHPGRATREIARTLKPGGACIMTVPVVNPWGRITRRAELKEGVIHHLLPEQYHGNPVGDGRALVTIDWSYGIGACLARHSGLSFSVHIIDDMRMGIRDPYNVVLVGKKGEADELYE